MLSTSSRCLKTGSLALADWMERLADAVADPIAKLSPVAPPPDAPLSPNLSTEEPGCTVPGRPVGGKASHACKISSGSRSRTRIYAAQNFAAMLTLVPVLVLVSSQLGEQERAGC